MEFDKEGKLILPKRMKKIIKYDENYDKIHKNRKSGKSRRRK